MGRSGTTSRRTGRRSTSSSWTTRECAEFARSIAPRQSGGYAAGLDADDGGLGGDRHDRPVVPGCRHPRRNRLEPG
jgi:hypothetical protein